jgi:MOSC domain-containing protein YiiM
MTGKPFILAQFLGKPKDLTDQQGSWRSSIFRDPVDGPVQLERRGLRGDRATQPFHGTPDQAVCGHFADHYRYWQAHYGMALKPGDVGENWTLEDVTEDEVCVGDIYRVGTALVQVSGARTPCATQARRVGRPDWVKLTLRALRTGIYLRVLEPGVVQAGDTLDLADRPNPDGTITALNRCYHQAFDADLARRFAAMPGLAEAWKAQLAQRLDRAGRPGVDSGA